MLSVPSCMPKLVRQLRMSACEKSRDRCVCVCVCCATHDCSCVTLFAPVQSRHVVSEASRLGENTRAVLLHSASPGSRSAGSPAGASPGSRYYAGAARAK